MPHRHTHKWKDLEKHKKNVLSFALVFAEDQLLYVLFSKNWLKLSGPLITALPRLKKQCGTIKKKKKKKKNIKAQCKGKEVWLFVYFKPGTTFQYWWFCKTMYSTWYSKNVKSIWESGQVKMPVYKVCCVPPLAACQQRVSCQTLFVSRGTTIQIHWHSQQDRDHNN